jgi:hypothetical protein
MEESCIRKADGERGLVVGYVDLVDTSSLNEADSRWADCALLTGALGSDRYGRLGVYAGALGSTGALGRLGVRPGAPWGQTEFQVNLKLGLTSRQEARERRIVTTVKPFRWNPAGNQSRPVELDQQPEASLAWWVGNHPCEA